MLVFSSSRQLTRLAQAVSSNQPSVGYDFEVISIFKASPIPLESILYVHT